MAVTAFVYGKHLEGQYGSTAARRIDFPADTIKCALATSSYTPDQDAHDFFNDITNEVVGTGYTAGGVTLASKTVTYTGASNKLVLDAADPTWTTSTITARYAIYYKDTGSAATSPLISYVDFGADVVSSAGTFTVQIDPDGIVKLVAA